jgi:hypothetical protein
VAALGGTLSRLNRRSSDAVALLMASTPATATTTSTTVTTSTTATTTTTAPVESGGAVPPHLAGRHTLLSTLACATRCVVGADDAALVDDAYHSACVSVMRPACELLERALVTEDFCVALSCVQLISALCDRIRSTGSSRFGAVLSFVEFARRDLEPRLLALLARLLDQATLPTLASAVLELLRTVCERDRETAERLFVAGVLKLLAPARVPRGLRDGYEPYKLSVSATGGAATSGDNVRVVGERNEWHSVWCEALRLVASLSAVSSLSAREPFSRQLQQFILVHRVSAATCISMSPARFGVADGASSSTAASASATSAATSTGKDASSSSSAVSTTVVGNKENDEPRNVSRRDPWSVGASTSGRRDDAPFVDAAPVAAEDMATDESAPATKAVAADELRRFELAYDAENARSGESELTLARLDEAACWLAVLMRAARHFSQWINLVGDDSRPVPLLMHVLLLVNEFALHLNAPQRLVALARALSREERHMTTRAALRDQQRRDGAEADGDAPVLKGILKGARDVAAGANAQQLTWEEQIASRGTFAHTLTAKMRDALLVALAVVRSVGPGVVPDDRRAASGLHANDAVALSRVLFVAEMEIEHHPSAGVSIGALVAAANVAVSDLKTLAQTARSKASVPLVQAAIELATSALYLALAHLRAHVALADAARLAVLRDEFGSELTGLMERIQRAFGKLPDNSVSKDDAEFVAAGQRFVSVILMMPSSQQ